MIDETVSFYFWQNNRTVFKRSFMFVDFSENNTVREGMETESLSGGGTSENEFYKVKYRELKNIKGYYQVLKLYLQTLLCQRKISEVTGPFPTTSRTNTMTLL